MNMDQMASKMEEIFEELRALRAAGQKEYAHDTDNAFANFERLAAQLDLPREKILLVYLTKHLDGIHAHVNGYRSQREAVKGRLNDAMVYLCLLRGMIDENAEPAYAKPNPQDGLNDLILAAGRLISPDLITQYSWTELSSLIAPGQATPTTLQSGELVYWERGGVYYVIYNSLHPHGTPIKAVGTLKQDNG